MGMILYVARPMTHIEMYARISSDVSSQKGRRYTS